MPYQLIGAPLSLYSGKVRGFLRWKNVADALKYMQILPRLARKNFKLVRI